jgi:hypothetical protein
MRIRDRVALGLFAVGFALPAFADYSGCVDAPNPPECIARRSVSSFMMDPGDTLETIVRHGLVDLVPKKSGKLIRGLYAEIGKPGAKMDSPEEQLSDSTYAAALRRAPRRSLMAAIALATAARHAGDPFADPVFRKLAAQANDPRVPVYALGLWLEVIGMSGRPPDFRTTGWNLEALWRKALERREQEAALLQDIAGTLAYLNRLKPQTEEFLLWYSRRPGLTPRERAETASMLAHHFGRWREATALLDGLGDDVERIDMPGVRTAIAMARLEDGYDAEAAHLVTLSILDAFARNGMRYAFFENPERAALEHAGARAELRELGDECLRRAAAENGAPGAADWFASASDFYLRAGDVEHAREVARLGVPFVEPMVRQAASHYSNVDQTSTTAMVHATQGGGTSPVVALYRTGAIGEALATGYLSGKDRYVNAARAGEARDPQWVIDYDWTLYIESMAHDAESSTDRAFQQRAYDGLVRMCGKPIADCFAETLRTIAQVAAGMGDETRMKEALAAAARQLDDGFMNSSAFQAMYVAGPWAHCDEILRAAKAR